MEHTVRYQKFGDSGQIVVVERTFKTSSAMEKHLDKVEASGNLHGVLAYLENSK